MAVQQSVGQVQIALWEQRTRTLDFSDFHLRVHPSKTASIYCTFNALLPSFDFTQRPTDRLIDEFARRVGLETDITALTTECPDGKYIFDEAKVGPKAGEWKEMVGRWNAFAEELWEDDDMLSSKTMIYDRMILVTERGQLDTKGMSDVFLIGNGGGGSGEKAVWLSGPAANTRSSVAAVPVEILPAVQNRPISECKYGNPAELELVALHISEKEFTGKGRRRK
ncbi:hypothetical protein DL765_009890 [Monosporascus sp. GIB2]|nr:hypothetical protein DL765_009890 [Monosporascus sp. GIB2]